LPPAARFHTAWAINIGDAHVVDSLLVQEKLGLKQHRDFLLCGVGSVQRDLEAITSRVANRRFPYKLERHEKPHCSCIFFYCTTFGLKIRKAMRSSPAASRTDPFKR
jgi:hypothetical protein